MKYFIVLSLLAIIILTPALASAAGGLKGVPEASNTILANGPNGVLRLINTITNWLFTILLMLAVVFIILAAYKYLLSGGGEEVGAAHKMIIYAAVAIAVAFLAKGIVFVVEQLVGGGGGSGGYSDNSGNGDLQIQYNGRNINAGINIPL